MKKLTSLFVMISLLFLYSCEKNDDITVSINESGSLEMKIVDNEKNPIENAEVQLYDLETKAILLEETTDGTGIIKMDKILQGSYSSFIKVKKEGKIYTLQSYFQIFTNDHKAVEYNPFANSGKVKISVTSSIPVQDFTKYMVALVPYEYPYSDVEFIKRYAYYLSPLGSEGGVDFDGVPADKQYRVVIYKENFIYGESLFVKTKDEQDISVTLYHGTVSVKTLGTVADYTKYDIYVTKNSFNNDIVENIKQSALFSGKLDTDGNLEISELVIGSYYIYLAKGDVLYYSTNFYIDINYPYSNVTVKVGSITLNVDGYYPLGKDKYSLAITRQDIGTNTSVESLKSGAITYKNLTADAEIKFTELPFVQNGSSYIRAVLYRGNKIYDYYGVSWYDLDTYSNIYFYVNE